MDLPEASLLVLDECHRSRSQSWIDLIESYPKAILLGLTATPARKDGKGLGDIYSDLVIAASYEELIAEGSLVPTRIFAPFVPDLKGVRSAGGDYIEKELVPRMDKPKLVGDIVETWEKYADDRPTVVFASGVAHSMHICEQFNKNGIPAEHIDGDTETVIRDEALARFRQGRYAVLTNCAVLTEGWDMPRCSCAVLARPTKSIVLYRQMAGRIQRPDPESGKTDCLILDHSGAVFQHGFPDDDMEWVLSKSEKASSARSEQREREGKTIVTCPECGRAYEWQPTCPECGCPAPKRKSKPVKVKKGQLQEVQRKRAQVATQAERQAKWNSFVGVCIGRGLKIKCASGMYKSYYGVYPNNGIRGLPRGTREWNMGGLDFYRHLQETRPHELTRRNLT